MRGNKSPKIADITHVGPDRTMPERHQRPVTATSKVARQGGTGLASVQAARPMQALSQMLQCGRLGPVWVKGSHESTSSNPPEPVSYAHDSCRRRASFLPIVCSVSHRRESTISNYVIALQISS